MRVRINSRARHVCVSRYNIYVHTHIRLCGRRIKIDRHIADRRSGRVVGCEREARTNNVLGGDHEGHSAIARLKQVLNKGRG